MATDNPQDTPTPEGTPQPTPEPITQEKFDETIAALNKQHEDSVKSIQEDNRLNTRELIDSFNEKNTAPPAPTISVTKEEAIRKLQDEADPTALLQYTEDQIANATKAADAKLKDLQKVGGTQISNLALQQAKADSTMPHFAKYEQEVMQAVNQSGNTDPAMIRETYKWVVGNHIEDILKEEKEKLLRQGSEEDNLRPGGGKPGRNDPVDEGIKPEEVLSERAQNLLEQKGVTPDQFAQKIGKAMPFTKLNEETGKNTRVTKKFNEGFADMEAEKEANRKEEEEFSWHN